MYTYVCIRIYIPVYIFTCIYIYIYIHVRTSIHRQPNALIIGRSSSCSMVLDYRTVSTVHAILYYNEGKFFLQDRRSSNGTMVYLQEPLELPFSHPIRLRMGRSTLIIQVYICISLYVCMYVCMYIYILLLILLYLLLFG
jgi:hypothetical protein